MIRHYTSKFYILREETKKAKMKANRKRILRRLRDVPFMLLYSMIMVSFLIAPIIFAKLLFDVATSCSGLGAIAVWLFGFLVLVGMVCVAIKIIEAFLC